MEFGNQELNAKHEDLKEELMVRHEIPKVDIPQQIKKKLKEKLHKV